MVLGHVALIIVVKEPHTPVLLYIDIVPHFRMILPIPLVLLEERAQ